MVKREVKCWCHCGIVVVKRDEVLVSLWDCGGEERGEVLVSLWDCGGEDR